MEPVKTKLSPQKLTPQQEENRTRMGTPETLLTIPQLEDLLATAQAMQQISNRGHEWDYVGGFSQGADEPGGGVFVGDLICLHETGQNPQVVLRIEYLAD